MLSKLQLLAPTFALSLLLTGCPSTASFQEVASAKMPSDVTWSLAADRIATSMSDVTALWFVERNKDGVIVRQARYGGTFNHNTASCAKFSTMDTFFSGQKLVDLNNAAMTESPNLTAAALKSLNDNQVGSFEVLNTRALWFARSSTSMALQAGASAPKVASGDLQASAKAQGMELLAAVATVKFTVSGDYATCIADGYHDDPSVKTAFAAFKAKSTDSNSGVVAERYNAVVLGSMIGLLLKEVQFDSALAVQAPPSAYNAKFSLNLDTDNISLNYRQYGVYSSELTLKKLVDALAQDKDPITALNLLQNSTKMMAIIATAPVPVAL